MVAVSRRWFIGGAASLFAAGAGRIFAADPGTAAGGRPALTFGVLSDVHVCLAKGGLALKKDYTTETLVKAFEWFRDNEADAVVIAGDMAHSGLVGELKALAEAWFRVFPGDKAPDGRPVERVFVFGNHDWSSPGRAKEVFPDPAACDANLLVRDPKKWWDEIFHELWTPFVRKTVKGYDFIGAHWCNGGCNGKREIFTRGMKDFYGSLKIDPARPFFHVQHPQPRGTAHGDTVWGQDDGVSTAILSKFPNAIAFSGHSHTSLTDEKTIWQGAFTSMGCGSLRDVSGTVPLPAGTTTYRGGCENYRTPAGANHAKWDAPKAMGALNRFNCRQGQLVRVYADRVVFSRREFVTDVALGPDLVMPLPAAERRPFAFEGRRAQTKAPCFPAGAKIVLKKTTAKLRGGKKKAKAPVWEVSFPAANERPGVRPVLYEIAARAPDGGAVSFGLTCEGLRFPLSDPRAVRSPVLRVACDRVAPEPAFSVTAISAWGHRSLPLS